MLVPSYAPDKVVETENEHKGYFTASWQNLILNLLSEMQRTLSNEGFVPPTLTAAQINVIQNNKDQGGNYTCAPGTTVYNSNVNTMMSSILNSDGTPIFVSMVAPTYTSTQITALQNATDLLGNYTCQYGTTVYNSTANSMMMAINNGSNAPVFKTVTLT